VTTGLPYAADNISGSENIAVDVFGISNVSGGAIGPQFMPDNAKFFLDVYEYVQLKLKKESGIDMPPMNLWSPFIGSMLVMAYISGAWYKGRAGYEIGDADQRLKAFYKWNPHPDEMKHMESIFKTYTAVIGGKVA